MRALCLVLLWLLGACAPDPADFGPSEALAAFLTAVERSTHAPEQRKTAYGFLDRASQDALAARAKLSNALGSRKLEPWEMLVPGRVSFAGQSLAGVRMSSKVDGDKAVVAILLERSSPIEVPMVREEGRWRVVLGLSPQTEPTEDAQ